MALFSPANICNSPSQQNKLIMYNLHQYNSSVRSAERHRLEESSYAKYLLRHEQLKDRSKESTKQKVQSFVREQSNTERPFVFEDDHYKHWRSIKPFRDVEDSSKFVAFKTFRHKPHYEMDKYYNERERREIEELAQRKEHLVRSKVIPEEQRSRSLRCQGPLNPKVEFRERKSDHEYLQPRLRFSNITDRERLNETSNSFDDKFQQLYKSFEMTKSKIGRTTVSPKKDSPDNRDSLDAFDDSELTRSKHFYFQKEQSSPIPSDSFEPTLKLNPEVSQRSNGSGRSKVHFKLAQTMHLLGKDKAEREQIGSLLKRTQYHRQKDLSNIRYNQHYQNHLKHPIL